ncbi:hypothetical protein Aduo_016155 [Ancylostoma duodenale]
MCRPRAGTSATLGDPLFHKLKTGFQNFGGLYAICCIEKVLANIKFNRNEGFSNPPIKDRISFRATKLERQSLRKDY